MSQTFSRYQSGINGLGKKLVPPGNESELLILLVCVYAFIYFNISNFSYTVTLNFIILMQPNQWILAIYVTATGNMSSLHAIPGIWQLEKQK